MQADLQRRCLSSALAFPDKFVFRIPRPQIWCQNRL
jgi:hypothetical protein